MTSDPSQFNSIQYYQFSNLLKNRIPFVLLNLETEVTELFAIQEKIYLRNLSHTFNVQNKETDSIYLEITAHLKEMNLPSYHPIILICQNGQLSEKIGSALVDSPHSTQKFENIYVVKNGYHGLSQEIELN